jgi:hypothetical protein
MASKVPGVTQLSLNKAVRSRLAQCSALGAGAFCLGTLLLRGKPPDATVSV